MQDLTQGSIPKHILSMAAMIGIGMAFQMMYVLVDLYFVGRLGDTAIAGVGAASNVQFVIMALTQVLAVGTMALIAQAAGRKDRDDANVVFNQSLLLALAGMALVLVVGYALAGAYMRTLAADAATTQAGITYLHWFLPGLALQFLPTVMGAALRGTGIAKPTLLVQMFTVVLNIALAPVLITGWLTGYPMGVAGAGLASSIAIGGGLVLMIWYFKRSEKYVGFDPALLRARLATCKRILVIGLPPGGEFALMFVYMALIYWVIRHFGAEAQAGYGIGSRVMQAVFLPAMAIAFATAPVAGQNVGARKPERVVATFRAAALMSSVVMLALTLLCQVAPELLVSGFTHEASVIQVAVEFLRVISWNFIGSALIFSCSGLFQALGNTVPALLSSASRMLTFAIPAVWLSSQPGFELRQLWWLSVATMAIQALLSLWLLRREFRARLPKLAMAV